MRKFLYPVLIFGFVLFSLLPTFYELSRSGDLQPNRAFELVHNFPTDYNFYLSRIRQGLEGRWTVVEQYTSEPHSGSFIHEMYLLMGRVGRELRVPWGRAGDIYHVARVVLAIALLAVIAKFCKGNLLAFMLAVTASSWPKLVSVDGAFRFGGYMPWWSVVDSLQRITFIPHLLAGQALIIFLIGSLTAPRVLRSQKNILFLGLLGFLLGMIFPPGLIFVFGVFGVFGVIAGVREKGWIGFFVVSAPAIVYLLLMTSMYPWKRLAEFDTIHPLPFDYIEYFKAIGPVGVFGVIGGIWVLWKKEKAMYAAVAWVIAWIAFLGIFHFIPAQSPLRFSEMLPNVPLGVLAAYLFYRIGNLRVLGYLLILLGLFHMYSSWLWQRDFVDHKIRAGVPLVPTGSYVMYPLKDFMSAIAYIQDHAKKIDIILSETTAGNYIPVYSGNTVFVGHDNTVIAEAKKEIVRQFFSGTMRKAAEWLEKERISLIFFGPQEREGGVGDLRTPYPFLHEVYKNTYVTVYATQ